MSAFKSSRSLTRGARKKERGTALVAGQGPSQVSCSSRDRLGFFFEAHVASSRVDDASME